MTDHDHGKLPQPEAPPTRSLNEMRDEIRLAEQSEFKTMFVLVGPLDVNLNIYDLSGVAKGTAVTINPDGTWTYRQ